MKINASVVKDGQTRKEYTQFLTLAQRQTASRQKYGMISMEYLLKDADSHLHVEISNDTLYDGTWGNFNLGAITLSGSFMYLRNNRKTENIFFTNPIASPGNGYSFAVADAGYELAEESLGNIILEEGV